MIAKGIYRFFMLQSLYHFNGYLMRILLIFFTTLLLPAVTFAQAPVYDSLALQLLDRMSDILGDLKSCSVTVNSTQEEADPDYGRLTRFAHHEIQFSGSNKFFAGSYSEKDEAGYWFNGKDIFYYSFKRNHYGRLQAEGLTSIEVIDALHKSYGIDFPAVDYFYPAFTDDLIAQCQRIEFFGLTRVGEQECYKIAASGPNLVMELWLSRDQVTLPCFMVIMDKKTNLRYSAHYSQWELNPGLPDAIFNFTVPPDATQLTIVSQQR